MAQLCFLSDALVWNAFEDFSSWLYARKIYDMQTLHAQGHPHVPGNISSL